jgi:hypothetical protein
MSLLNDTAVVAVTAAEGALWFPAWSFAATVNVYCVFDPSDAPWVEAWAPRNELVIDVPWPPTVKVIEQPAVVPGAAQRTYEM